MILGILASSGAGGAATAYESIATLTGTGSSGTITFSSIPSTYTHLQVRGIPQAASGGFGGMKLRINSDTANNYSIHQLLGDGATASATGYASTTYMWAGINSSTAAGVGIPVVIIDILDYASTAKNKTVRSFSGVDNNGSGQLKLNSGVWLSTSAISSLTFTNEDGVNWTTSTTFALYGIKAA